MRTKKSFQDDGLEFARTKTGLDGYGNVGPLSAMFARWYARHAYPWQNDSYRDVTDIAHYFLRWENGMEP